MKGSTKQTLNNPCETKCGDSGCHCVSKSLENMDHLLLVSETGHIVTCLCGNYQVNATATERFYSCYTVSSRLMFAGSFRAAECSEIKAIVITVTFISSLRIVTRKRRALSLKYIVRDFPRVAINVLYPFLLQRYTA